MSLVVNRVPTPSALSTKFRLLQLARHQSSSTSKQNPYKRWRKRCLICKAEFSQDAPFAMAIGACVLNSLIFPITSGQDEDGDGIIDSTDARFAVMGIISFIPYFNWLSWVFAWLDTNKRRYVVYSIVYLIPYLRTPEESWLPIASIVICILHIQLEVSIRNGDIQGFQQFYNALKHAKNGDREVAKKGKKKVHSKLGCEREISRNERQGWGVPKEPLEDEDADSGGN